MSMAEISNEEKAAAASLDFDDQVVATGLRLYDLIEGETPSIFKKNYWTGKVMDWSMQDEAFKVEMFRFVDVFPALNTPESVATHLREYFARPDQDFPDALQWGIKAVSPDSFAAKLIAKGIAKNIEAMGSQFILGATPAEAAPALKKLRAEGLALTIDLLGEAVVSEREAENYSRRYLELLDTLDREQHRWATLEGEAGGLDWGSSPKVNISIKASAMYSQMKARAFDDSVTQAKERLRPIFRRAKEMGAFVYIDMVHRGR
jgi:RHH-type proline utilization regulon transcriptional repressor/proline dehydrogenase/delta 1-pyrroline-5-carboxylate dehydrogenase